ncbi:MAG: PDZ domain-containing protein, partial [Planctomycetota bacterium]|nr:PDZ domain-containing protein [Planctomycetota bacterium]
AMANPNAAATPDSSAGSARETSGGGGRAEIPAAREETGRLPVRARDVSLVMDGTAQWGEEIGSPDGRVSGRPLLGVIIGGRLVDAEGRPVAAEGLLVLAIESGSPADQIGLKVGDLILETNGRTFTETSLEQTGRFVSLIKSLGPGAPIEITYERAGLIRTGRAILGRYRLWERQP